MKPTPFFSQSLSTNSLRSEFPILSQKVNDKDLVYLDSAATSIKPRAVIERIHHYYSFETANVHRGAHHLANLGTRLYEESRMTVQKFLNAKDPSEIIFVKGTTEAINLVAASYGETFLKSGDKVVVSIMEHHSNIVPWQILAQKNSLIVEFVDITDDGDLNLADFEAKVVGARFVAITACSNTLGTINDVASICKIAKKAGAKVLIDGAQLVCHQQVDVQKIDCDFFVFSGHKLFGPTGIGVLYGKKDILENMPPYQSGGSMIAEVKTTGTTFNEIPFRFEAGTPHISGVIGLKAAIDFVEHIGYSRIHDHGVTLLNYLTTELEQIPDLKIIGRSQHKAGIVSFNISGCHHSDLGQILDQQGLAVRVGHHCTQPLMNRLGISGTVRASLGIHNNKEDIDKLINAVKKARELLL